MHVLVGKARAFVYAGDWVADCPREGCGSVEHLFDRANPRNRTSPRVRPKPEFGCSNCRMTAPIDWPPDMIEITRVLALRPVPQTRNWYPKGHDTAVRFRVPHGQTVDELRAENIEHGVTAGPEPGA